MNNIINLIKGTSIKNWEVSNLCFSTKEYDKFKNHPKNRTVSKKHVLRIVASMKENLVYTIIYVNEKLEILDGQHRFQALKQLNLPLNIVILKGAGEEAIQKMNLYQNNWSHQDYLQHYIKENKINYIWFNYIKETYNINFEDLLLIIDTFNNETVGVREATTDFDTGELTVDSKHKILKFLDALKIFEKFTIYNHSYFVRAFLKLYLCDDFDLEWLKKRVDIKSEEIKRVTKGSIDTFGELLEDVCMDRKRNVVLIYSKELQEFGSLKMRKK